MAKAKVCPYVTLDENGKLDDVIRFESYRNRESIEVGGSVSEYSKQMYVHLPEMEVDVPMPTEREVQAKAADILRAYKTKLRAEHQQLMTKLQFMENQLLGLDAPDVLDRS